MPEPSFDAAYWNTRYATGQDPWDAGAVTEPLRAYFAQLGPPDQRRILIPGAGRAYEAEYLHRAGWPQVFVADFAPEPLQALQQRVPDFPAAHLLQADFFQLEGPFELLIEQTFFCALDPALRPAYAQKCAELLRPGSKLVGLLFDGPVGPGDGPPFGGTRAEYRSLFEPFFDFLHFEAAHNSIKPRQGRELFISLRRK